MPELTPLSPELSRSVSALARSLVAAARTWTLYPPEHPAVRAALTRLGHTVHEAAVREPFAFGVTPETLLLEGLPASRSEAAVAEAASWLHQRDILQLTFAPDVPPDALDAFLRLLSEDPAAVRQRGGPAAVWQTAGHPAIAIEQIDFAKVLADREEPGPVRRKDDVWRSIVRAVLDRRKALDEAVQKRMLEIAGDVFAISELAQDVMAPSCAADGSPMLTSQAAAVVAAYRHLVGVVDVMAPERRAEVLQNLADATATMDPHVVMQILGATDDVAAAAGVDSGLDLRRAVADAMDDSQVAQLLATTLAIDQQATDRLASVFGTIAPDEDRRRRVLTMTKSLLRETAFGRMTQFQTLWTSMEELLLSYNERPFVSEDYRVGLDEIGGRAERMAASDLPADVAGLVATLDQENVRRLSVVLLVDLLNLEQDATRAPELARDVAALAEDLLLAGDYDGAALVTDALAAHAARGSITAEGCRLALDGLVDTAAFREAVEYLGEMDEATATVFARIGTALGPPATDALRRLLEIEELTPGRRRATALIRGFGAPAVSRLAPLIGSREWFAQRNAAELLGELAAPEAVPLLQPLLRGGDPRVAQAAVRALSNIDDPSAARAVHTVLRAAAGELRQAVVAALVAERDPRVVPLLARILDESDPFGGDHPIVLETLGAVATLGGDQAVPAVDRTMRKRRWFARRKVRAVRACCLDTLRRIGTPAASAAIAHAASDGDRLLRRLAREAGGAA